MKKAAAHLRNAGKVLSLVFDLLLKHRRRIKHRNKKIKLMVVVI